VTCDAQWAAAIGLWTDVLGPVGVEKSAPELASANRATFEHPSKIAVVLRPGTKDHVAACLAIAANTGIPLHPVSRGRNWGYGSRLPVRAQAALLSLDRLNGIRHFDGDLGLVEIEPGVTFDQLARFLEGSIWWPPQTGAGADNSVIGNALERGIGKGPYEEMTQQVCGYEVMLATGGIVRTGLGGTPHTRSDCRSAAAPGPLLAGLFSQSNLGVVLSMTLMLHPRPRHQRIVWARLKGAAALTQCVDALRPLLQRWPAGREVALLNEARVQAQCWELPDGKYQEFVAADIHDVWTLGVTLWSDEPQELDLKIDALWRATGALTAERGECPPEAVDIFAPSADGLRSAYWAKAAPFPADPDPDRDGCGVIWIVPVLPMRGEPVASALSTIGGIMRSFGFPAAVSLRLGDGRTLKAVLAILYDRNVSGADARASVCSTALRTSLLEAGLMPYRLSVSDMGHVPVDPGSALLLRTLKAWADPNGVISPGRYIG